MLTILVFILVLGILVFIHELGHFMMAKKVGVRVEEFGFGLPPRIWGFKKGETIYSVNWLPIGGFVKLSGEDPDDVSITNEIAPTERKRLFWARTKIERSAILLAGVTMNFILAVLIISFIFTRGVFVPTDQVHIEKVTENSPASSAGLLEKDIVVKVAGREIKNTENLITTTKENAGREIEMEIVRKGEVMTLTLIPRKDPPENQGPLGVVVSNLEEKKYPIYTAPFYGTLEALKMSYLMLSSLAIILFKLLTFQPLGADVAGPIGIAQATGQAIKFGYIAVLQLTGILSLNLAIINALPIPALDGGRLLFVVLEKFLGRRVKPKAERIAHQVGMAFLLALIALVTVGDIVRLIRG